MASTSGKHEIFLLPQRKVSNCRVTVEQVKHFLRFQFDASRGKFRPCTCSVNCPRNVMEPRSVKQKRCKLFRHGCLQMLHFWLPLCFVVMTFSWASTSWALQSSMFLPMMSQGPGFGSIRGCGNPGCACHPRGGAPHLVNSCP